MIQLKFGGCNFYKMMILKDFFINARSCRALFANLTGAAVGGTSLSRQFVAGGRALEHFLFKRAPVKRQKVR